MDRETTFENARVGDMLWDSKRGWGEVISTKEPYGFPLKVRFERSSYTYLLNGSSSANYLRTLFWDEVKFEAPPRPKRKVKKVVKGYVSVYTESNESGDTVFAIDTPVWDSPQTAKAMRPQNKAYIGEPLYIQHEYVIED